MLVNKQNVNINKQQFNVKENLINFAKHREGDDSGLFITLVPKVFFVFVGLLALETFIVS